MIALKNRHFKYIGVYGVLIAFPIAYIYAGSLLISISDASRGWIVLLFSGSALIFLHTILFIGVYKSKKMLIAFCIAWFVLYFSFLNSISFPDHPFRTIIFDILWFWGFILPLIRDLNVSFINKAYDIVVHR